MNASNVSMMRLFCSKFQDEFLDTASIMVSPKLLIGGAKASHCKQMDDVVYSHHFSLAEEIERHL
jgi:hypothetical protein